jgi:hypothetical protein
MSATLKDSSARSADFANLTIPLPGWYKQWLKYCRQYDMVSCLLVHTVVVGAVVSIFLWGLVSIICGPIS